MTRNSNAPAKYIQCYTRIETRKRSSAVIFQMACPPPPIFYNKKGLTVLLQYLNQKQVDLHTTIHLYHYFLYYVRSFVHFNYVPILFYFIVSS